MPPNLTPARHRMIKQSKQHTSTEDGVEQPLIYHLIELRDRLLRVVLVVALLFLALIPFSNYLFTTLSGPLTAHLPEGGSMIAIEVASPFLIPFKLTLVLPTVNFLYWMIIICVSQLV